MTTIGTSWTKLGEQEYRNSQIGSGYVMKVSLWARYRNVSGNTCILDYKTVLTSPYPWTESGSSYGTSWRHIFGTSSANSIIYAPPQTGAWTFPRGDFDLISVSSSAVTGGTTVTVTGGYLSALCNFGGDLTFSGTVPSFVTPPSGLVVSVGGTKSTGALLSINVGSWGSPDSSAAAAYDEVAILGQNSYGSPYRYVRDRFIVAADVDNDAPGDLTIESNTQYYYGGSAYNSILTTSVVSGQLWTLPEKPVGTNFHKVSNTSAEFTITETSVGTGRTVQLQYRYKSSSDSDFGAWTNAGSAGNNQVETVTLSGLAENEVFDVELRALAGTGDYSKVSSYPEAFTTRAATISVVSTTDEYNASQTSSGKTCKTTFNYLISASGTSEDRYEIYIMYRTADGLSPVIQNTYVGLTNVQASGSFSISLYPGRKFSFGLMTRKVGEGSWGPATPYEKTTPTFVPNAPYISEIAFDALRRNVSFKITPAAPGAGETLASISWIAEFYNENTNSWFNFANGNLYAEGTASFNLGPYNSKVNIVTKLRIRSDQTNTFGYTSPQSKVTFKNRPKIWGKVVPGNNVRANIVGVRVKNTSGSLTPGNPSQPVVFK